MTAPLVKLSERTVFSNWKGFFEKLTGLVTPWHAEIIDKLSKKTYNYYN